MAATVAELPRGTSRTLYQDLKGRERCVYLSTPKTSKAVWLTSLGPKLVWGNQETIFPVSQSAAQTEATPRLADLAVPKKNYRSTREGATRISLYSCGRNSVIWDVSPLAMKAEPTPRLSELARFKMPPLAYKEDRKIHALSCGRESPIWNVSEAAKRAREKYRLEALARAKTPHRDYLTPREIETVVSGTAKKAVASSRLENLARPKSRPEGPFRDPKWPVADLARNATATPRQLELAKAKGLADGYQSERSIVWEVADLARNATATPRQLELAKAKGLADGYQSERSIVWEVSRASRRTVATSRTTDLSKPIMRATMDHVQFNPDAFIVSDAAKKARCPPRIEELSQPVTRS